MRVVVPDADALALDLSSTALSSGDGRAEAVIQSLVQLIGSRHEAYLRRCWLSQPEIRHRRAREHAELDVTVPIAFVGPGIARAIIHRPVRTVDIAPTLAEILGVRPAEWLDGVALPEIVDP